MPVRPSPKGKFRGHPTLLGDPLVKTEVLRRIHDVDSTAEKGKGLALDVQRTLMSRRINPPGHSAYYAKSDLRKLLSKFAGEAQAV